MANYLVAKCGNTTSSYSLQSVEPSSKPYLRVSNSYLPLTTETKTGLQVKANNNNIYAVGAETKSTTTTLTSPVYMKIGSSETSSIYYPASITSLGTNDYNTYTVTTQRFSSNFFEGYSTIYITTYRYNTFNTYTTTKQSYIHTSYIPDIYTDTAITLYNMSSYLITDNISSYYYSNPKSTYEFVSNSTVNIEAFKISIISDYFLQTSSTIGYYNSRRYIRKVDIGFSYSNYSYGYTQYTYNSTISDLYISYNTSSNSNNGYTVTMPGILTTITCSTSRKINSYTTTIAKYIGSITIQSSSYDSFPIGYETHMYRENAAYIPTWGSYGITKHISASIPAVFVSNSASMNVYRSYYLGGNTYTNQYYGTSTLTSRMQIDNTIYSTNIYQSISTSTTYYEKIKGKPYDNLLSFCGMYGEPVYMYRSSVYESDTDIYNTSYKNTKTLIYQFTDNTAYDVMVKKLYDNVTNYPYTPTPSMPISKNTYYYINNNDVYAYGAIDYTFYSTAYENNNRIYRTIEVVTYMPIACNTTRKSYYYTKEFDALYTSTLFLTTADNITLSNITLSTLWNNTWYSESIPWIYTNSAYISIGSKPITKTITVQ